MKIKQNKYSNDSLNNPQFEAKQLSMTEIGMQSNPVVMILARMDQPHQFQ